MNQQIRSILFSLSGLLVLVGAALFLTHWVIAPYLFAVGAAGVAVCYLTLSAQEMDFRHKRLHRLNVIAGFLMIIASGLMFNHRKEWVVLLTIAAVLQLYTAFVSPQK